MKLQQGILDLEPRRSAIDKNAHVKFQLDLSSRVPAGSPTIDSSTYGAGRHRPNKRFGYNRGASFSAAQRIDEPTPLQLSIGIQDVVLGSKRRTLTRWIFGTVNSGPN